MEPTAPAAEAIAPESSPSAEASPPAQAVQAPVSETYELLDSGGGRVLERLGNLLTARPCGPAWWRRKLPGGEWRQAADPRQAIKAPFKLKIGTVRFNLNPGGSVRSLAPELQEHWARIHSLCTAFQEKNRLAPRVLHLFGGAGGSTLAAAQAGAAVTHVDASADAIKRARDHAAINTLANRDIRWVVDDPLKFAQRERAQPASGSTRYDLIILDPHTSKDNAPKGGGRPGPGLGHNSRGFDPERDLAPLLATASALLSDKAVAVILFLRQGNPISPTTLLHLFRQEFSVFGGTQSAGELLLRGADLVPAVPSGVFGMWSK